MQHKNVDIYWEYRKFPRHQVAVKKFKMRGRNTILSHYNYTVDTKLSKCVSAICGIPCACPSCFSQLDKYWLPNIVQSYQPRYYRVGSCYYNKIFDHYNYWIIVELLDNKKPQFEVDNIHVLIITVISTNQT